MKKALRILAAVAAPVPSVAGIVLANSANAANTNSQAGARPLVAVLHNVNPAVANSTRMGDMSASDEMSLAVSLKPHDEAGLRQLLAQVGDPTPARFMARYGPSEADVASVVQGISGLDDHAVRHSYAVPRTQPNARQQAVNGFTPTQLRTAPAPRTVSVDGANFDQQPGQGQVELDVELVQAVAPAANTLAYEAPNSAKFYSIEAGANGATALHDITSGNNGAFSAGPGCDAVTGLGSHDGAGLASALGG